jgi:hypothetical protein
MKGDTIQTYYRPLAMRCSKMQELERRAVPLKHAAFKKKQDE